MPEIFLKRRVLGDKDYLPKVCLVCGGRPARPKKVMLVYQPLFWMSMLTRVTVLRMQVAWTPLCDAHSNYFKWVNWPVLAGAGVLVLVIVGTVVGAVNLPQYDFWIAPGGVFLLFAGGIALVILHLLLLGRRVRATQIDDAGVRLANVAPEFAEALVGRRTESRGGRDDEDGDDAPARRGGLGLLLVLGGVGAFVVVLLASCGVVGVMLFTHAPGLPGPPTPPAAGTTPAAKPIDPAWDEKSMTGVYLSDLQEIDPRVGYGVFGKNGMLGYGVGGAVSSPITVDGRKYPRALSTAPPSNGRSSVKYRLGRGYKLLHTWVAVNDLDDDHRTGPETPLTFVVLGDGKALWTSAPVRLARTTQECRVNVEGVDLLELQVDCPGIQNSARAVWLDPQVFK